jgi:hypothetical protein
VLNKANEANGRISFVFLLSLAVGWFILRVLLHWHTKDVFEVKFLRKSKLKLQIHPPPPCLGILELICRDYLGMLPWHLIQHDGLRDGGRIFNVYREGEVELVEIYGLLKLTKLSSLTKA